MLAEPVMSIRKALEYTNLAKIQILLIVGSVLLVVLSLIVNFFVVAQMDAGTPSKRREIFHVVILLGLSSIVLLVLTFGLSAHAYASIESLGSRIRIQNGGLRETCLATLASGTIAVLFTAINILLL